MVDRMNCKGNFLLLAVFFVMLTNGCAFDSRFPTHLYFLSLCSQEAGEQIFRTVDNVDSIFQMRAPAKFDTMTHPPLYDHGKLVGSAHDASWGKGFWIEDYPSNFEIPPSGLYATAKTFKDQAAAPFTMYKFFEGIVPASESKGKYLRLRSEPVLVRPCQTWHCYAETEHRKDQTSIDSLQSLYGYTWTELHPSWFSDRIIGIEYKVVDLTTNETLAIARDYYMFPKYATEKNSSAGGICKKPNGLYAPIEPAKLIISVLRPSSVGQRKRVYETK